MDKTAIRNAATVIILRDRATGPCILMGQRGAKAAFMPNKFVFPGGAVDTEDAEITLANAIPTLCNQRLSQDCDGDLTKPLCIAAIRELWEETGLILGQKAQWQDPPSEAWNGFAARGYIPSAEHLTFVFRAITPPGRSRRFDARFFLVDAAHLIGDIDDFSAASDELSHLQWVPLHQTCELDLPFITEVVLAEIVGNLGRPDAPASVPFFKNDDESSEMLRLRGYELPQ